MVFSVFCTGSKKQATFGACCKRFKRCQTSHNQSNSVCNCISHEMMLPANVFIDKCIFLALIMAKDMTNTCLLLQKLSLIHYEGAAPPPRQLLACISRICRIFSQDKRRLWRTRCATALAFALFINFVSAQTLIHMYVCINTHIHIFLCIAG